MNTLHSQLLTGSTTPDAIRDINVTNSAHDSVEISYAIQSNTPTLLEAGVYIDGALTGRVPSTYTNTSAATLLPGNHSLEIIPLPIGYKAPQRQGYTLGDRVYLEWDASPSPYLSHYNVYRDSTKIGTVSARQVFPLDFYTTTAGGRVSVFGYPSTDVNDTFTVTVGASTFTFDGDSYPFVTGSPISLPYGVMIIFHDDADEYADFDIFIGVQDNFLTNSQPAGTYVYSVEAVDTAGNVSTQLSKTISVVQLPTVPTVNEATMVPEGNHLDTLYINVYSDYNAVFDTFDPYINTSAKAQRLQLASVGLGGVGYFDAITLPPGARYYLFPVSSDRVELENLVIYTVPEPTDTGETFNVPADLTLSPAVDGNMSLEFTYRFGTPDSATSFDIFYGTDPDALAGTHNVLTTAGVGGAIKIYNVTLPALYATGTTVYAQVRAKSATAEGELSDIVSAVAIAEDPTLPGNLYGVQT